MNFKIISNSSNNEVLNITPEQEKTIINHDLVNKLMTMSKLSEVLKLSKTVSNTTRHKYQKEIETNLEATGKRILNDLNEVSKLSDISDFVEIGTFGNLKTLKCYGIAYRNGKNIKKLFMFVPIESKKSK